MGRPIAPSPMNPISMRGLDADSAATLPRSWLVRCCSSRRSRPITTVPPVFTACSTRPRSALPRSRRCTGCGPAASTTCANVSVDEIRGAGALALFTIGETPWSAEQRARDPRTGPRRRPRGVRDPLRHRLLLRLARVRRDRRRALRRAPVDADLRGRRARSRAPGVRAPRPEWRWHDEVYQFRDLRPDAEVLLRVRDGELDLDGRRGQDRRVRVPAGVVLLRGERPRVLDEPRPLPVGVGVAGVSPPPRGRPGLGARRIGVSDGGGVSKRRNFSNWAYWRLNLERSTAADALRPTDDEAWRAQTRDRLAELLGPHPAPVPLDLETTEEVDCGTYTRARIVFDVEDTMSVPAYLLVPHARRDAPPGPAVLAIHGHGPGKAYVCGIEPGGPGDDYAHVLATARLRRARARPARVRRARRLDAGREVPVRLGSRVRHDGRASFRWNATSGTSRARSTCCARIRSSIERVSPRRGPVVRRYVHVLPRRARRTCARRGRLGLPGVVARRAHRSLEHVRFAGHARPARRDRARRHRRA